jgi:hypothetical protein
MRLEQENRRRAEHLGARLVAVRLGDNTGFLRKLAHQRMVAVVGVLPRMGQDEGGADGSIEIGEPE